VCLCAAVVVVVVVVVIVVVDIYFDNIIERYGCIYIHKYMGLS
jgi:hypothetical protein